MLRISSAEELEGMFHDLFACQLAAWEVVEYQLAILLEKGFPLRDTGNVSAFELEPPILFQLAESYPVSQLSVSLLAEEATYPWSDDMAISTVDMAEVELSRFRNSHRHPEEVHR